MANSIGQLVIQLNADTSAFTRGLTDAKQLATNSTTAIGQSFTGTTTAIGAAAEAAKNFKSVSADAGDGVGYSMMEARHSVMLLGDEFGVHLPRALTTFVAGLGPIGPALQAAFPFLAVAVGATLLIEHLSKVRDEAEKLALAQAHSGISIQETMNALNDKLLGVQIQADELTNNHLGAMLKQLQLIDHETLGDLISQFSHLGQIADTVFSQLKTSWFEMGSGAAGAKASLDQFTAKYEMLLATGKTKEASEALQEFARWTKTILDLQKEAASTNSQGGNEFAIAAIQQARAKLSELNIGWTQKEIAAQQELNDVTQAQLAIQSRLSEISGDKKFNVLLEDIQKTAEAEKELTKTTREYDDLLMKMGAEQSKAFAKDQKDDLEKASKAALDYVTSLKALSDAMGHMGESSQMSQFKADQQALNTLRSEGFITAQQYAEKMIDLLRNEEIDDQKLIHLYDDLQAAQKAAFSAANNNDKTAENAALARQAQIQAQINELTNKYDQQIKQLQTDEAKLNSSWSDYFTKMSTQWQNLGQELRKTFQADLTNGINSFSQGIAQCIVQGKNLGDTMLKVGDQILESIISVIVQYGVWRAILAVMPSLAQAQTSSNSKSALSAAGLAGANMTSTWAAAPWPIDALAPAMGAEAFSVAAGFAALASAAGGMVVDRDQLAMVHTNEHILPSRIAQTYEAAASSLSGGGAGGGGTFVFSPNVSAIDAAGVQKFFRQHGSAMASEFKRQMRIANLTAQR